MPEGNLRVGGGPPKGDVIEQIPELARDVPPGGQRLSLAGVPLVVMPDPDGTILAGIYEQRKNQAKVAFWVAIPLGIVGMFLIFSSPFVGNLDTGLRASIGGGIIEALTFFMIRFNREVNRGVDRAVEHLNAKRRIDRLFGAAEQIVDTVARDAALAKLIETLAAKQFPGGGGLCVGRGGGEVIVLVLKNP